MNHTLTRTQKLLNDYKDIFKDAAEVIIAPIYKARDKSTFGINEDSIIKASKHKNIRFIGGFDEITRHITKDLKKGDVLVVMGAGKSYQLTKQIYENL